MSHISPDAYNNRIKINMKQKYTALFTSVNLLLGVGPLIIPMPFFDAGIILSIIWMIVICIISYTCALFINQSMGKVRQHDFNSSNSSLLLNDDNENEGSIQSEEDDKNYDHMDQFRILYGGKWVYFPSLCITFYLLCTSISKCILTGTTMEKVFDDAIQGDSILKSFNLWLALFFICGAVFSFKSIQNTKIMQVIIITIRVLSIILMIVGAIYLMITGGVKKLTPKDGGYFNVSNFVQLFSNSCFALMYHHSLPAILNRLRNTEDVAFTLKYSFLISGSILLLIPITGCMAFGDDLGTGTHLKYYNFDFQGKFDATYWVVSFYVFLNIAAFSVYIIVIRTNILRLIKPKVNPLALSKQTIISSLIILAIILVISSLLQNQIQIVLDVNGGVIGTSIMFFIPAMEVYKARKIVRKGGDPVNYIKWMPVLIGALGVVFLCLNLYSIISKHL